MYYLTAQSDRASRTILNNSQNNCSWFSSFKQIGQISYFHVTLVRAYLSYTSLALPVDPVAGPGCEALSNIGYTWLGMYCPTGSSFSSQNSRTGYLFEPWTLQLGIIFPKKSENELWRPFLYPSLTLNEWGGGVIFRLPWSFLCW